MDIARSSALPCALAVALALAAPARADEALRYSVQIEGGTSELRDAFRPLSRLIAGENAPPPGLPGLEQRADGDAQSFVTLLRSEAYYDGTVTPQIDASKMPVAVVLKVDAGPRYTLGDCKIVYRWAAPAQAPTHCAAIGLAPGMPARAAPILQATERLVRLLEQQGRPAATVSKRVAIVDHATRQMRLTFDADPGPAASFGKVVVTGTERTHPDFLAAIVPWKPDAPYDLRQLDTYKTRLADLNLFDSLTVAPDVAALDGPGPVPVDVTVHEAPHHSIELGAKYATDTGPGGKASWEDRNLWGRAEDLRLSLEAGTLGQSLSASLLLPHRPYPEQTLGLSVATEHDTTDAYTLDGIKALAQISTPLGGHWSGKAGVGAELASVDQGGQSVGNLLLSLPLSATYDSTGSLLDPSHGWRLQGSARPVVGASGGARAFLVLRGDVSFYQPLSDKLVAAERLALGSILFSPAGAIPPDERFYAGGGGSVRGYAFQHVSPRDANNVLIGGRGLAETSLELRYRLFENIGIVAFADAGMVSQSAYFADADTPRVGAGLGLRYYTGFGPLRLDIGTPVNPRRGDAPVQLYISLGQAF